MQCTIRKRIVPPRFMHKDQVSGALIEITAISREITSPPRAATNPIR